MHSYTQHRDKELTVIEFLTYTGALTFKPILAEALIFILNTGHAMSTIQAGPSITGAVVHTLTDGSTFCEAVRQIQLLVVDGHLSRQQAEKLNQPRAEDLLMSIFNLRITGRTHLSDTALKHSADVGGLRKDVHAGDSSQVHGSVDIQALCFSWRRLLLQRALVDL